MEIERQRDWDAGWAQLDTTIAEQDVWLLTDRIKLYYLFEFISPGMKALEIGCGSAKLSGFLAEQGIYIFGLDQAPWALRVARQNFSYLNVEGSFMIGDAFRIPLPDDHFDLVFSTGLLEHFHDPIPLINEMKRVLRPGGVFFSDVAPLKFSLLRTGFYLRGHHKMVTDEYYYNDQDIEHWLKTCGLKKIRVFPSGVVPPLIVLRRIALARSLSFKFERLWTIFDGTPIANWLGFFYLAFAIKE